ncbi:MAG: NB-ARC domain-containing protein, partial [Bacteroidota bacterium]
MSEINNTGPIHNQFNQGDFRGAQLNFGPKTPPPKFLTKIPKLSDAFIGRSKELKDISKQLSTKKGLLLINGLGGMGKTTIATRYVAIHESRFDHIAWIEQTGSFPDSILASPLLMPNLGITPTDNPEQDAIKVLNAIANLSGEKLLVIDNAEEDLGPFIGFLPTKTTCEVLVTSRKKIPGLLEYDIDSLAEEKAIELFLQHYELDKDKDTTKAIVTELDRHTLTIELLAKTAQARQIKPLQKVLDLLKERGLAIGRKAKVSVSHNNDEEVEKIFPYLQRIFEWSESSPQESWLIKQFIFLPPIHHSLDRLREILQITEEQEEQWDDLTLALEGLTKAGWLNYDAQLGYKMHRVIRELFLDRFLEGVEFEEVSTLKNGVADL